MGASDRFIAELLIEHGINLLRFGAGVRTKVLALLQRMEVELTARLVSDQLSDTSRSRAASLLQETARIIRDYYAEIDALTGVKLKGLAHAETAALDSAFKQAFRVSLDVSMPASHMLEAMASDALIHGAPSAAWWQRQAGDTVFRFANEVRQGMAQAETNSQIVARIVGRNGAPGVMDICRSSATRLVQASVQTVANTARRMTFECNTDIVDGVQQLSTLDGRTSDICIAYSGATWDMDYQPTGTNTLPYGAGCPRHFGCRSIMVPVMKSFQDMGIALPELPMSSRASSKGQVSANITMQEWLDSRTEAQLDEQLGRGRAQLYRDKVITLQQLLDQSGNPLSLAQLTAKYLH